MMTAVQAVMLLVSSVKEIDSIFLHFCLNKS